MRTLNIIKISIGLKLFDKDYWVKMIFFFIIGFIILFQLTSQDTFKDDIQLSSLTIKLLFLVFFEILNKINLSELIMKEKYSKRIEYYLSNGISIFDLLRGYSISNLLLTIIPNYIIIGMLLIFKSFLATSELFFFIIIIYPFTCFSVSLLLNIIILKIKSGTANSLMLLSSFQILFIGLIVIVIINNLNFKFNMSTILNLTLLITSMLIYLLSLVLYKNLNNEKVILSSI